MFGTAYVMLGKSAGRIEGFAQIKHALIIATLLSGSVGMLGLMKTASDAISHGGAGGSGGDGSGIESVGFDYTVEYYKQTGAGESNYTKVDSESGHVDGVSYVVFPNKTYVGYEFNRNKSGGNSRTVTKDAPVAKFYYNINGNIRLTVRKNEGIQDATGGGVYSVGAHVNIDSTLKRGYEFDKWEGDGIVEATAQNTAVTIGTENMVVTATAKPITYHIEYDLNDSDGPAATNNPSNPTSYTVQLGGFMIQEPTRPGYAFMGWSIADGKAGNPAIFSSDTKSFITVPDTTIGDISLKANWSDEYFSISYDFNDSGLEQHARFPVSANAPSAYKVTDSDITIPNPEMEGYIFLGWKRLEDISDSTSDYHKPYVIHTGSTGDVKLVAFWTTTGTSTRYVVEHLTENLNGTYNMDREILSAETGELVTPTVRTYTGFTSPPEKTVAVAAAGDTVVTYKYRRNTYTVMLTKSDRIQTVVGSGSYLYGAPVNINCTLKPSAGSFRGWVGNVEVSANGTKGSFEMPADNVFLEATCAEVYNISYNYNGAEGTSSNPATYTDETATFTLKNPTLKGYTFKGWSGTGLSGMQKKVTIEKGSTGDRAYTANWSLDEYTITYNLDGGKLDGARYSYNVNTETFEIGTPTKDGYVFTGWKNSPSSRIVHGTTGNLTYTATWRKKEPEKRLLFVQAGDGIKTISVTIGGTTITSSGLIVRYVDPNVQVKLYAEAKKTVGTRDWVYTRSGEEIDEGELQTGDMRHHEKTQYSFSSWSDSGMKLLSAGTLANKTVTFSMPEDKDAYLTAGTTSTTECYDKQKLTKYEEDVRVCTAMYHIDGTVDSYSYGFDFLGSAGPGYRTNENVEVSWENARYTDIDGNEYEGAHRDLLFTWGYRKNTKKSFKHASKDVYLSATATLKRAESSKNYLGQPQLGNTSTSMSRTKMKGCYYNWTVLRDRDLVLGQFASYIYRPAEDVWDDVN